MNPNRNLDELDQRSAAFVEQMAPYLEEHDVPYRIDYGLKDEGNVDWGPEPPFGGKRYVRLGARWEVQIHHAQKLPEDSDEVGDRALEESGLGELMYYDGWESCAIDMDTGKCAEDGPGKWATQFWYERSDLCSDHDVEANKPISSYVFRPRVGSEGVSLERSEYTREMEQRLSTKKMKAKLLR